MFFWNVDGAVGNRANRLRALRGAPLHGVSSDFGGTVRIECARADALLGVPKLQCLAQISQCPCSKPLLIAFAKGDLGSDARFQNFV